MKPPIVRRVEDPLSQLFKFKNEETIVEIIKLISQTEGVPLEDAKDHLISCHNKQKSLLLMKTQRYLEVMWLQNPHLALSDFKGLISLAMNEIERKQVSKIP